MNSTKYFGSIRFSKKDCSFLCTKIGIEISNLGKLVPCSGHFFQHGLNPHNLYEQTLALPQLNNSHFL